jgi:hypothetical protein
LKSKTQNLTYWIHPLSSMFIEVPKYMTEPLSRRSKPIQTREINNPILNLKNFWVHPNNLWNITADTSHIHNKRRKKSIIILVIFRLWLIIRAEKKCRRKLISAFIQLWSWTRYSNQRFWNNRKLKGRLINLRNIKQDMPRAIGIDPQRRHIRNKSFVN